ncbi:hypothetical protein N0V87_004575 [Didymella glomerata]|uniref:RBR-type E3 ubiquitin transferase n=1 Tax=Didymella glomerata TaxID=749621 RepID=A0A9W8X1L1_9PLEO|nr:hypothetical protein N0V87_004575 [Didymella glomerata]
MAPSTRRGKLSEPAAAHGSVTPAVQPGSTQDHPIELEDTPPPEQPAARPTNAKGRIVKKPARNAKGRFIKSEASPEPKVDRKKVVKTTPPPKPKKPAQPEKTECVICAITKNTKRNFKASGVEGTCEHFKSVCDTCVQKQIKTKMSARQLTEAHLPCMFPECGAVLDHASLKIVLSKALFMTWDTAVIKHLLAADASYVACLNPKCGIYFSAEDCGSKDKAPSSNSKSRSKQKDTSIDKAACPHCEHELCLSCNRPLHSGSCDSVKRREDKQSEKAIKKLGAKPCPKCGVNIEKQGGCDHMNCQRCRHNFCWECLGQYNGNANSHAEHCSHRRPMIAHDIGNFVNDNLTVAQINALIERARQDREAGRAPRPNIRLAPGVQLVNGVAVGPAPAPVRPPARPSTRGIAPRGNTGGAAPRRRIVLREEDEGDDGQEQEVDG